jgi:hypothetical protein
MTHVRDRMLQISFPERRAAQLGVESWAVSGRRGTAAETHEHDAIIITSALNIGLVAFSHGLVAFSLNQR